MSDPSYTTARRGDRLEVQLRGEWSKAGGTPDFVPAADEHDGPARVVLLDGGISGWDSMLMVFVMQALRYCRGRGLELDVRDLPPAVAQLLRLATAVEQGEGGARAGDAGAAKPRLGLLFPALASLLEFIGGCCRAFARLLRGKARLRGKDLLYHLQQVGPRALGIITLTSVLVGMILAYLGSVQLGEFGAEIYVADLVAIGMCREMGPLMTAVILSGRTGASYAAQIGTMQVNEEVNALRTLGLSAMEFLVLPRLLALLLVMPLLCIYADILGMAGGALVAIGMDVNWTQYFTETRVALAPADFFTGLIKSAFFALVIGIAGCRAGLQCGRDANAVGLATTAAVVRALVWLIVTDAFFNILYYNLEI